MVNLKSTGNAVPKWIHKLAQALSFVGVILLVCPVTSAFSQTYPDKPIRLIVPSGAGGPTDVIARLLAERMRLAFGQTILVENRGGAGGMIGARFVASSAPDGYTLLFGNTATLATIPAVSKNVGYDPTNLVAVGKVMDSYQMLVVYPDLPVKNVTELIQYIRANPSRSNYSAAGVGNLTHLSGELFKSRIGADFTVIQYKSGAESVNSILAGQTQFTIDNVTTVKTLIQEKRLRALAVTSPSRKAEWPDLPTMEEAGVNDVIIASFFGVVAPPGTPKEIIQKLNAVINEGIRSEAFQESLTRLGAQISPDTPENFQQLIAQEVKKWTTLWQKSGIKID